jgi:hypothetical protein
MPHGDIRGEMAPRGSRMIVVLDWGLKPKKERLNILLDCQSELKAVIVCSCQASVRSVEKN